MDKKIRVLVVDDSAFMRKAMEMMLADVDDIQIVDSAKNGQECIEKIKLHNPDVVTLDIEMPVMDGLTALKIIMKECPVPVIMLSSLTSDGAEATIEALNLGAVDFIPKQMSFVSLEIVRIKDDLVEKIRYFATNKMILMRKIFGQKPSLTSRPAVSDKQIPVPSRETVKDKQQAIHELPLTIKNSTEIVVIGSSTGGPAALQKVIPQLPANFPLPVLLVQHMPPAFTKSLADRLDSLSKVKVVEATDGEMLKPGCVYISPGNKHMIIKNKGQITLSDYPVSTLHKPSVDVMMDSVYEVYGRKVVAVIMTGMGQDGTLALEKLAKAGAYIIGQDEESCVVYGMPKKPNELGYSKVITSVDRISDEIVKGI